MQSDEHRDTWPETAVQILNNAMIAPDRGDGRSARRRRRMQLVASRMWIVQHEERRLPCQVCTTKNRVVTRSSIVASYLTERKGIAICHKCLGTLDLKRQNEQEQAERAFYAARMGSGTTRTEDNEGTSN